MANCSVAIVKWPHTHTHIHLDSYTHTNTHAPMLSNSFAAVGQPLATVISNSRANASDMLDVTAVNIYSYALTHAH